MRFPGFIGPSYTLDSVNVDSQRTVNLYPEINEVGKGKESDVASLKGTPGLRKVLDIGSGPIRCIHVSSQGTILVASGNSMYRVTYSAGMWFAENLSTDENKVFLTSAGVVNAASTDAFSVFVDGSSSNYVFVGDTDTAPDYFTQFGALGYSSVEGATHVQYIDGFLVYNQAGTNQFFASSLANPLSVDPLDFASSEGDPDNIQAHIVNNRDLWFFNSRTTELFTNTGNADFPFERVQGGFVEQGCIAPYSAAKIGGSVYWLGRDAHGQGVVYSARGLVPQRISTHAVEQAISRYQDISRATAFTYQQDGHLFYQLNFPEGSWVFDAITGFWHERAYTGTSGLQRHRANCHAFIPELGVHLVGDYETSALYVLDEDYFFDNTTEITRMRAAPHLSGGFKRFFCSSFQLDMETGIGLNGIIQGTDPQVILDFSDDGGHTWKNEKWASVGKIGEYKKRVIWRRLGKFRDRVFRVKITDPVGIRLIGAEIGLEEGAS